MLLFALLILNVFHVLSGENYGLYYLRYEYGKTKFIGGTVNKRGCIASTTVRQVGGYSISSDLKYIYFNGLSEDYVTTTLYRIGTDSSGNCATDHDLRKVMNLGDLGRFPKAHPLAVDDISQERIVFFSPCILNDSHWGIVQVLCQTEFNRTAVFGKDKFTKQYMITFYEGYFSATDINLDIKNQLVYYNDREEDLEENIFRSKYRSSFNLKNDSLCTFDFKPYRFVIYDENTFLTVEDDQNSLREHMGNLVVKFDSCFEDEIILGWNVDDLDYDPSTGFIYFRNVSDRWDSNVGLLHGIYRAKLQIERNGAKTNAQLVNISKVSDIDPNLEMKLSIQKPFHFSSSYDNFEKEKVLKPKPNTRTNPQEELLFSHQTRSKNNKKVVSNSSSLLLEGRLFIEIDEINCIVPREFQPIYVYSSVINFESEDLNYNWNEVIPKYQHYDEPRMDSKKTTERPFGSISGFLFPSMGNSGGSVIYEMFMAGTDVGMTPQVNVYRTMFDFPQTNAYHSKYQNGLLPVNSVFIVDEYMYIIGALGNFMTKMERKIDGYVKTISLYPYLFNFDSGNSHLGVNPLTNKMYYVFGEEDIYTYDLIEWDLTWLTYRIVYKLPKAPTPYCSHRLFVEHTPKTDEQVILLGRIDCGNGMKDVSYLWKVYGNGTVVDISDFYNSEVKDPVFATMFLDSKQKKYFVRESQTQLPKPDYDVFVYYSPDDINFKRIKGGQYNDIEPVHQCQVVANNCRPFAFLQ